ncbi:hypothetical protein [Nocardioides sp. LHG3406-4]|uniref:hypothetical protein n=1 Tax=Nocardioides sp. LHG3406-4 TaxID=2804575 RepID=UPI003CFB795C
MSRILVLMVVLVGLGVLATWGTTGASWRDRQSLDAGAVRTGNLILLNGDEGNEVNTFGFTALSNTEMGPGDFAQAPLSMANAGTADLRYRLAGWTSTSPDLRAHLELTVTVVPSAADCPTTGAQPGAPVAPATLRPLGADASETLCIRMTLPNATPQTAMSGTVSFEWYAEQDL